MSKNARLNYTHYVMKTSNKRKVQQIVFNHSSDIDFRGFMNIYEYTAKPYSFLVLMLLLHHIIFHASEKLF